MTKVMQTEPFCDSCVGVLIQHIRQRIIMRDKKFFHPDEIRQSIIMRVKNFFPSGRLVRKAFF